MFGEQYLSYWFLRLPKSVFFVALKNPLSVRREWSNIFEICFPLGFLIWIVGDDSGKISFLAPIAY